MTEYQIPEKFLKMCNMGDINLYISLAGNELNGYLEFYSTFLTQSDARILQHQREKLLDRNLTLTEEEYTEFEIARQFANDEIRRLHKEIAEQTIDTIIEEELEQGE